ncbi:acyltransferase family protein [Teredinibacter turnerae]|uniref:acyltransferase family protein n=1 Tax=Teredinibacter turnerae TaxID=2426 RepID=UPI00041E82E9|nr:acyltransferase family protein [Teredinibacter turnerae]
MLIAQGKPLAYASTQATPLESYQARVAHYSTTIKLCRVLCIFFMTYVHIHLFKDPALQSSPIYLTITTFLRDIIGRSSVPLLSVISGFLVVGYFGRKSLGSFYYGRMQVLIYPLLFWKITGLLLIIAMDGWRTPTLNNFFPLTGHGGYPHLTFLRDLFVVCLLSPLLFWLVRRFYFSFLVIFIACIYMDFSPIILRSQILGFFVLGIAIAIKPFPPMPTLKYLVPVGFIAVSVLLVLFKLELTTIDIKALPHFDDLVLRPICAYTMFVVALEIAKTKRLAAILVWLEPPIFLLFLSHFAFGNVFKGIFTNLPIVYTPTSYTAVILIIPVLCFVAAIIIKRLLSFVPKNLSVWVAGK